MAIENASTPDELDAGLPLGTDFKKEGDNHLRVIKTVIKNALQGIKAPTTQLEAENIESPVTSSVVTPLRVYQHVSARIATQALAEGGTDNFRLMTSLKTKQYVDNRMANQATAEGGTDGAALMSSLATKQYVDKRRADTAAAEAMTNDMLIMTPLRSGQTAQKVFNTSYTNKVASQAQSDGGSADDVTITPLKARVTGDGRYLRLAQTTAFTRGVLGLADAAAVRGALGLGNAATSNRSNSTTSTSTVNVATSAAVRAAALSDGTAPTTGTTYRMLMVKPGLSSGGNDRTWQYVGKCMAVKTGGLTIRARHASKGNESRSLLRILKNGSVIGQWRTSANVLLGQSSLRTASASCIPGDVFEVQQYSDETGTDIYSWAGDMEVRNGNRVFSAIISY